MKRCTVCGEVKPLEQFHKRWEARDGRRTDCARCNTNNRLAAQRADKGKYRDSQLRTKYGITLADYEAMRIAQNGCCAICKTEAPGGPGDWHLDHCHASKVIRGLLCSTCNVGLGMFKDNPLLLAAAANYIESHRT
jgi:hypothetical protein